MSIILDKKEVKLVIWLLCKSEWTNVTNGMSQSAKPSHQRTAELGLMVNCMANRPNVQNHTQRGLLATVLQLKHKIYVCGMIWIIIIMYVLYYNKKKTIMLIRCCVFKIQQNNMALTHSPERKARGQQK